MYDVIIIGGGPAGLTAAIYTARKKLKTLVITVDIGGQTNLTEHIENYPGYSEETPGYPSGPKLMNIFEEQVKKFGVEFIFGKADSIEKTDDGFAVTLTNGEIYEATALILAYGKVPKSLGIPGEEKFIGRGVSTCATCDAPVFSGKTVAVIGGGNSALESAELLTKFAKKVYIIHRRDEFRADEIMVEKIKTHKNIEIVLNSVPVEIAGSKFVESLAVEDVKSGKKRQLTVNGIFVEIGYEVKSDMIKNLVDLNRSDEIITNENCETSHSGIFACGDVTNIAYKQTIISAGEGAKAGLSVYNYLQKLIGKEATSIDWGKSKI
ncbi:MAG: thioredoxin-disulfide reductase [Candidatus Aenigmatarchaeota archaeon]